MMHVRYPTSLLRLWLCVLALAGVQVAQAQALPSSYPSPYPVTYSGNTATYGPTTATAANAARYSYGHAANGPVYSLSTASHPLPAGRSAAVTAKSYPPPAAIGRALANFGRKIVPALVIGNALYDLAQELDFKLSADGSGALVIQREDPTICASAPCYDYQALGNTGSVIATFPTLADACAFQATRYNPGSCQPMANPAQGWNWVTTTGYVYYQAVKPITKAPAAEPGYLPATEQEFVDAISNKTGWATGSKIDEAIRQAVESGEPLSIPAPSEITGPVSVPGPTTTTTQVNRDTAGNPTGTTTTTTNTTYNLSYGPTTITNNTTNITTVTNPDGTSSTSTESADEEPQPDQCEKYPDSIGCAQMDTPTSDALQKKTHAVTVTAVSFASSSVCPSPLSFTVRGSSYGVSYQPLCDRLAILKALFLALAGVLAAFIVADSFRVT